MTPLDISANFFAAPRVDVEVPEIETDSTEAFLLETIKASLPALPAKAGAPQRLLSDARQYASLTPTPSVPERFFTDDSEIEVEIVEVKTQDLRAIPNLVNAESIDESLEVERFKIDPVQTPEILELAVVPNSNHPIHEKTQFAGDPVRAISEIPGSIAAPPQTRAEAQKKLDALPENAAARLPQDDSARIRPQPRIVPENAATAEIKPKESQGERLDIIIAPTREGARIAEGLHPRQTAPQPTNPGQTLAQITVHVPNPNRVEAGQSIEIALDPPELGKVRIVFQSDGNGHILHVSADRPETADLLRRHSNELAQEFRAAGFSGLQLAFQERGTARPETEVPETDGPIDEIETSVPSLKNYTATRLNIRI
ncbi:MAG TPA: flagellar hook-length control protein FliK [Paracoccaceae bacterium]|nr:flagellar hook-length control protein FliK [Paracoccaceae bacterium]